MSTEQNRLSLVIPAYNEEESIGACLEAALKQELPFAEIIVVDNNSSDNTLAIAKKYKGVKVISELRQGVVHARGTGFDAAKGTVIARIDADTILPPNWTKQLENYFSEHLEVAATSGKPYFYDIGLAGLSNRIDWFFRSLMAVLLGKRVYLHGANMAIRKSAWLSVRNQLCGRGEMHEDFDIAIHLQRLGLKVTYANKLRAGLSARRIDSSYKSLARYANMSPRTYLLHQEYRGLVMYIVVAASLVFYYPARSLYRGYDPASRSFSLLRIFSSRSSQSRIDPTIAD